MHIKLDSASTNTGHGLKGRFPDWKLAGNGPGAAIDAMGELRAEDLVS